MSRSISIPKDAVVRLMQATAEKVGPECAARLPGWSETLTAIGIDEANQLLFPPKSNVTTLQRTA